MLGKATLAVSVILLSALCTASAAMAEAVKIRAGWAQTPGHLAPLVEELAKRHPEIFHHQGKSYVFEAVRFQGSTPQIQAIAVSEIEIAAFAPSSLALAIGNARLDMRVVADVIEDGYPDYFTQYYVVRNDGPKTVEELKGKRIATNAIGSSSDSTMRVMFRKHGIQDGNVVSVETNFANMPAMIEDGKVDLIAVLPQFAHGVIGNPQYRTLFTARDAHGASQSVLWAMRADFIAKHRPAVVDFFEDHIRAVRWFLDPGNRAEALDIAAYVTKVSKENLAYVFTREDFYRSPDDRPNIAAVQKEIEEGVTLGILPKRIEVSPKYVDLSLIEDAKRRIDGK
jgi:sulfonate transport system substrate-binding protein